MKCWRKHLISASSLVLVLWLSASGSLQAQVEPAPNYSIKMLPPDAELTLIFSSPPVYQVRETTQGQVIEFDRPLDLPDLGSVVKRLSAWVENISASYDALLVQVKPGVTLSLTRLENNLQLLFRGQAEKNSPVVEPAKTSLALQRVDTLLLSESGHATQARQKLNELISQYPDESQLLLDLARVEEKLGNWREALSLYERAEQLKPESTLIKLAKARLLRVYGSRLSVEGRYSEVGEQNKQTIGKVQVRALRSNGNVWLVDYEVRELTDDVGVRRVRGEISPLDAQRQSLRLALESALQDGEQTVALFAGAKKAGLGWIYERTGDVGTSGFQLQWGRPWYETAEAFAGYGFRHQLALYYSHTARNKFSVYGAISVNRYGLDEVDEAANSSRFQLFTRYWAEASGAGFSVGYALDWEDVYDLAQRTDTGGMAFKPLPLEDRELHTLDVGWNSKISKSMVAEVRLGYEHDQQRDANAPYGRLGLIYQPDADLEASLNLLSGLSTYRQNEDEFYSVSANVTWFF